MKKKKECGFSLAEALVTLLIVCLITIASIPILTKKKRDIDKSGHGKWMCSLNSEGEHVYWSTSAQSGKMDDPDTWTKAGNYCKFVPPNAARNFAISASGGGGGGAGADSSKKSWVNQDVPIEYPGTYYMLAIGGGGGGGGSSDKTDQSRCGGTGGIIAAKVSLYDSVSQLKIIRGNGGSNGTGGNKGKAGDGSSSTISVVARNSSTGNTETNTLIEAGGGTGGYNGQHGKDHAESGGESGYADYHYVSGASVLSSRRVPSSSGYQDDEPYRGKFLKKDYAKSDKITGIGHIKKSDQAALNNVLGEFKYFPEIEMDSSAAFDGSATYVSTENRKKRTDFCAIPGMGGSSKPGRGFSVCSSFDGNGNNGSSGKNGYVAVYTKQYKSGEGGKAGEVVKNVFYPKFEKPLKVTIGAGGKGGNKANGEDGGTTTISNVNIMPLTGGAGGKMENTVKAYEKTPGGDGEKTKLYFSKEPTVGYGGFSGSNSGQHGITGNGFGAGGGGGGLSPDTDTEPGIGGDGTPGVVIIEW